MLPPVLEQDTPGGIAHSPYETAFEARTVSSLYHCWHRSIDILFSLCGMIALGALLPIVALCNCLESPGPVFYMQERLGYMGKPFTIYKLRSMHTDAEREGNAIWATRHDSRTTRTGRLLRATHLDELPQVINILRGEMSLIGPRPERGVYAVQLEQLVPLYRQRLLVRPGLTGLAQVKHTYGGTRQDELIKLDYDFYYVKHQSWQLDVVILLRTVGEVVSGHGI